MKHRKFISGIVIGGLCSLGFLAMFIIEPGVSATSSCTLKNDYKNPCRPILAAYASRYPEGGAEYDAKTQSIYHETRIGRQLDAVHTYLTASNSTLGVANYYFASRGTLNVVNWKPANVWADAGGGNASINSKIDSMAASIKTVAPQKIMLTIFHEPENDVSPGGSPSCGSGYEYKGTAGTTAQYVQMWQNVRNRFDAAGVTNVIWAMNYMGFDRHNCMVKEIWPGNALVDWVLWDPYMATSGQTFSSVVSPFYNFLTSQTDAGHNFTSKPWGLNEWGAFTSVTNQNDVYRLYAEAKQAVENGQFPKLKMYSIFDTYNVDGDFRIRYTGGGTSDTSEEAAYKQFAVLPQFTDEHYTASTPPASGGSGTSGGTNNASTTGSGAAGSSSQGTGQAAAGTPDAATKDKEKADVSTSTSGDTADETSSGTDATALNADSSDSSGQAAGGAKMVAAVGSVLAVCVIVGYFVLRFTRLHRFIRFRR